MLCLLFGKSQANVPRGSLAATCRYSSSYRSCDSALSQIHVVPYSHRVSLRLLCMDHCIVSADLDTPLYASEPDRGTPYLRTYTSSHADSWRRYSEVVRGYLGTPKVVQGDPRATHCGGMKFSVKREALGPWCFSVHGCAIQSYDFCPDITDRSPSLCWKLETIVFGDIIKTVVSVS